MLTFYRSLDRLCQVLNKLTTFVVLLLVAVITCVNVAQILGRFVFFYSLPWSEELSVYIFFWLIMLGGAYCVRGDSELRIDIMKPKNPQTARILKIVQGLLALAMMVVFLTGSLMHVENAIRFRQVSSSLQFSMAYVYLIIPIGFLFMALEKLLIVLRGILGPRIEG